MSYDLYFKPRQGDLSYEMFDSYFRGRSNFQCESGEAWYENKETGVYFHFLFQTQETAEDDGDEPHEYFPVAFNVNYFRPSYFILEAESVITAFVKHFDLLVSDPQWKGMGQGEYDAEKLVRGWNFGNEGAFGAILEDENNRASVSHLPTSQLHHAWRWNLSRCQLQNEIGEAQFVPQIMFMNIDGAAATMSVWPDGIPAVIAPVDYVCIPRKELAPTGFFHKGKEDVTFVAWEVALPVLIGHGTRNADGSICLDYVDVPSAVAKFVKSLPSEKRPISVVAADRMLDRELFERSIA